MNNFQVRGAWPGADEGIVINAEKRVPARLRWSRSTSAARGEQPGADFLSSTCSQKNEGARNASAIPPSGAKRGLLQRLQPE